MAGIEFIASVQIQEVNGGGSTSYAAVRGKTVQNAINVRQAIGGHVAHEGALHLTVSRRCSHRRNTKNCVSSVKARISQYGFMLS